MNEHKGLTLAQAIKAYKCLIVFPCRMTPRQLETIFAQIYVTVHKIVLVLLKLAQSMVVELQLLNFSSTICIGIKQSNECCWCVCRENAFFIYSCKHNRTFLTIRFRNNVIDITAINTNCFFDLQRLKYHDAVNITEHLMELFSQI